MAMSFSFIHTEQLQKLEMFAVAENGTEFLLEDGQVSISNTNVHAAIRRIGIHFFHFNGRALQHRL